jgi:integrase
LIKSAYYLPTGIAQIAYFFGVDFVKSRFTAGKVAAFICPPEKAQAFLWDSDTNGLGLKASPGGSKKYILESRLKSGETIRLTIGSPKAWSIAEAQEEARRLQTLIDQGNDPRRLLADQLASERAQVDAAAADEARRTMTVDAAWRAYLAHHKKRWGARHLADHENLSQSGGVKKKRGNGLTKPGVLYPLLKMCIADVGVKDLIDWQAKEAETRANNARQGFEMFRAFWRWCATRPEYSAMVNVGAVENKDLRAEVPSRKSKRFDVLERAQLTAWFAAVRSLSNPVVSAYLQGLLLTGARREELAALRWSDVDFKWGSLWVKDKVAEEGRKIPLTPYLSSLLLDLKRINETKPPSHRILHGKRIENDLTNWKPSPWVFFSKGAKDGRIAEPRVAHKRALAVAGLSHVTLHGLRRTFASLAEWVEMPRGIVAQIMGHAPNATAEKHYINRPLELLAVWHGKYEGWILEQAGVAFEQGPSKLTAVASHSKKAIL